jgi:hypothetical protein
MKRAVAIAVVCWLGASAQAPSLPYLDAYRAWKSTDPELEQDAAKGATGLLDRVNRVADAAGKANEARVAYWRGLSEEGTRQLIAMGNSGTLGEPDLAPPGMLQQYVATELRPITNNLKSFANDRDPGIQQLRGVLERERQSLEALSQAIMEREQATEKNKRMLQAVEAARGRALEQYQLLATTVKDTQLQAERERASWANYYSALSGAIASAPPPPPEAPQQPVAITINGIRINNPARPAIESAKQDPASAQIAAAAPVPPAAESARTLVNPPSRPASSAGGVVKSRYVGTWSFPAVGGQAFGTPPESATLEVREENNNISGSLSVRFKMPAGSPEDPVLRFTFAGEFKNTRVQSFPLETADGAKGTIELIPGTAFNLLEVNFQTDPRPGKVSRGNFVLLKE